MASVKQMKKTEGQPKSHFVVKVQATLEKNKPKHGDCLVLYNKERSFLVRIDKENNDQVYDELFKNIVEKGWHGLKGYFHVIFNADKPGKFKINSTRILPHEPW